MNKQKVLTYKELVKNKTSQGFYLVSPESQEERMVPQWHFEYLHIDEGKITSWAESACGDPEYVDVENEDKDYKNLFFVLVEKDNPIYESLTDFIDRQMYPADYKESK